MPVKPDILHGGDLADAMALAGDATADAWLDLSTGISPYPYPAPAMQAEAWKRLPGRQELSALAQAAAAYYGAPAADGVVIAPGSESLLQALPLLVEPGSVAVIAPTYGSHAPAWRNAGHDVLEIADIAEAGNAEVVVLVNPNNPDGTAIGPDTLRDIAGELARHGGLLLVDEAFADVMPEVSGAALAATGNVVVLKSFGKFFGLPGLRLGFAIAPTALAARMRAAFGAWPVSRAALAIGEKALRDRAWQRQQRQRLQDGTRRLDELLGRHDVHVAGGTDLFRLIDSPAAARLFAHLLTQRIYVRAFSARPRWLRIGLPESGAAFERLEGALKAFDG